MTALFALITNAGSGTGDGRPDAAALLGLFRRHGLQASLHELSPGGDMDALLDRALAESPGALVAAGGDGTVNAVAARAIEHGLALGVLPLGTLNHFARDLGLPEELDAAVRVIAAGRSRCVDVGTVNDKVFLNNASIGLYATIVVDRERQQRRLGRGKWLALCRATMAALRDPDAFEAVIDVDGRQLRRRTPFLFVGNNDYIVQGPDAGQRARLDDGSLSLYVLHPRTAFGLLWLALRTLLRGMSGARDLDAFSAAALTVEAHASRLDVARDGEVEAMATPVRFAVRPGALRVFAADGQAA
jgi:Sphingosine kinase and enzymes related to eukaryotic diacylglycerol kinase